MEDDDIIVLSDSEDEVGPSTMRSPQQPVRHAVARPLSKKVLTDFPQSIDRDMRKMTEAFGILSRDQATDWDLLQSFLEQTASHLSKEPM